MLLVSLTISIICGIWSTIIKHFSNYHKVYNFSLIFIRFDYSVNSTRCSVFYPVVRKYFPNLKDGSLEPGYSGIRPKLSGPGHPPSDFVIQVRSGIMSRTLICI